MDSNNWRPAQTEAAPPPIDGGDWRSQLLPDSRNRIVNKIMETLKRHLPFSGQDGLQELKQIAIRFEEKIYSGATSQSDYLRKISLKMLTMESKSQNSIPNGLPSNSSSMSKNPQDSVPSQNMQSQVQSQSQSVPHQMVSNQSQARQQILAQNMQNNIASAGVQTTANLPNSLPHASGLTQNMPNVSQNTNMQSISGISQNTMGNTMNQGVTSSMFTNAQRQMQGRQLTQQVSSQQQQSQNNQQYMYQQQLQHQMLKQKLQQGNIQQPVLQPPLQQQPPPSQSQQNMLQSTQQPMMQTSSVMQPSMMSGLQQNQQSSVQQPSQPGLQQHQQAVLRQPQQSQPQPQQSAIIQQQQTQLPQQSMMTSQGLQQQQQQQQLMGQQPNTGNMQQNQLIGQQSNIVDMQQQQQQQQRLLGQQNLQNLPSQQQTNHQNMQQQHIMGQQSNLSNMHQQQLGHQSHAGGHPQQHVMGTQSGNTNLQANHSVHMIQQPKAAIPQQNQNSSLLPGGGQPAQPQSQSQQQLMSQIQSQPAQLQQQWGLQQQTNSLQHNMQPRMQNPNSLLQQQNMIDQQKQLFQSQRAPTEAPSSSLDSTAQTGSTSGGDWQEEVYQKIKHMKGMYYADLNEMYQKISMKLKENESHPQQPRMDQLEKLKMFKSMLEMLMQVLQTTKNNILPTLRGKLPSFEKQIMGLLSNNRPKRPGPSMQPGQILPQMQPMQQAQQPHSQISQVQSHDVSGNPQLQSMNLQGSIPTMQQSNVPSLQRGSVPSLSAITSSQNMAGSVQTNSNLDSGQGSAPNSMQQVGMASLQQNLGSAPQQANINSMQSQSGVSMLQPNINPLQSSSNMLQNQHLKQQQEQIMQNQQLKQQLQSRHIQQQLLQKQQLLQQQQQQLHQQAKQQQASQISAHKMPQLHQNDVNEKMRQGLGLRSGAFPQQLSSAQRFAHQQLKPGTSFPVSSSQLFQTVSPQINQHSPQIDQQNLQQTISKGGTPLQSANSPFAPSPSTPLAPSPMPGDSEKPAGSSLSNAANIENQQSGIPAASQSLSIGTPGISPSPLFECTGTDGAHGNSSTVVSGKSCLTEEPLDRLLKAVKSMSPKAYDAAICDIGSVVSMIDRTAGSAPGNGSRATVGEDLVAMTKCRLQARNFPTQDGGTGTKRMRRWTSAIPVNVAATVGSVNDDLRKFSGSERSELESTATSSSKKARKEVNLALLEEIREINERLIDTVVDVSDEDLDPLVAASASESSEGAIVRCSFIAVSLSPNLKAHYTSAQISPIQPLRILVPANYPNCSPILLDKLPVDVSGHIQRIHQNHLLAIGSNGYEDLSVKVKSRFSISLRSLSQPMSLKEIARTWDDCARAVICKYAQLNGGGTFSSKYGTWENCLSTA